MDEDFQKDLVFLINKFSKENDSNTPDYILAQYLNNCLEFFNKAVNARTEWYEYKDWENKVNE